MPVMATHRTHRRLRIRPIGCAYDISPIPTSGGDANSQTDDADKLVEIWSVTLGYTGSKGFTYKMSDNAVHVQILTYNGITGGITNP